MPDFARAIRDSSGSFWKVVHNVWLADTELTAKELSNELQPHTLRTDRFLVRPRPVSCAHVVCGVGDKKWTQMLSLRQKMYLEAASTTRDKGVAVGG